MEVRLKTGYFGNRRYNMGIDAEGILLSSDLDIVRIPRASIIRFSLDVKAKSSGQFSLMTTGNNYEGSFVKADEAKQFVETLCGITGLKYEIAVTLEWGNLTKQK